MDRKSLSYCACASGNSARKLHACCVDFKPPTRPCISGATCAYLAAGLSSSILSGFLIGAVIRFGPSRDSSWLPQAQPCDLRADTKGGGYRTREPPPFVDGITCDARGSRPDTQARHGAWGPCRRSGYDVALK